MTETLTDRLAAIVGAAHVSTDPDVLDGRSVDHTGRYRGQASALVRPGSADEVAAVLRRLPRRGVYVTVQGGRTSLVAGTVPEHDDVLLSTERLTAIGEVDTVERRVRVGAGATLAAVQRAATDSGSGVRRRPRRARLRDGRRNGVDERGRAAHGALRQHGRTGARPGRGAARRLGGARGTAKFGATTPATTWRRCSSAPKARSASSPASTCDCIPRRRTGSPRSADSPTSTTLVAAGREFRDIDGIAALELIDARASALTAEHLGVAAPVDGAWQLLIELAGDTDQTERLADALEHARLAGEPAVGVDVSAQQRLWQVRESVAEVLGVYGPPLKFDVSLPLSAIAPFARESAELVAEHAPDAIPVLFGHIGEGNLHLNVLRCALDGERERALYSAMMALIAGRGGNVSSEHGVGSRKRDYVGMSRTDADIAAMRTVKTAFDPSGYLNPAVLFD